MSNDEILKLRAERLAKELETEDLSAHSIEFLVFNISTEKYAIEIPHIKEVYPLKEYTPLPCVKPYIFGLVNIRRKIVSIFDLGTFFSLPSIESKERKLVILENEKMKFALLIDGIIDIKKIDLKEIQTTLPNNIGDDQQDFIMGIAPGNIILINGEKLLSCTNLIIDEKVV